MKAILEARGINTSSMVANDMRVILANHSDFVKEKTIMFTIMFHYCDQEGVLALFLP